HKKTILRVFFDMTHDNQTSHDRLQRVRGYTIGGKSWIRESGELVQNISPTTHFQLGNLFSTLISYSRKHVGLAVAKCALIKHTPPGSGAASVSVIPRAEMHLPASAYIISGQVISLVPLAHLVLTQRMAWHGMEVLFRSHLPKKPSRMATTSRIYAIFSLRCQVASLIVGCVPQ
ncbi:hypothetical protein B0H14DRAFT_2339800, partial [Mycena olivaceomarginata]